MLTSEYLDRLRQLIAQAPDGFDVASLQSTLASAEAAGQGSGDRTKVWFLLDRSGSMQRLADDLIGGFNQFLVEQKAKPGKARMTVVLFDSENPFEVVVDGARIGEVPELTATSYQARGMTPLFDALGTLVEAADRRIDRRAEAGRSVEDQLVLVFTDGHENDSTRFDRGRVFDMVKDRQENRGWTFVFMGANQDSYATGSGLGLAHGSVQDFAATPDSVRASFAEFDRGLTSYRAKPRLQRIADRHDFFEGRKLAEEALQGADSDQS